MDTKGIEIDQELFRCSICLDLLKVPVIIPCGHSYCMSCVNTHWNGEVGKQSYSCPQCRQSFTQRPVLVKNTMLALLMAGLKKNGPPAAPVAHCSAAHGDVSCDLCSGRKVKAVKSCLQCLVSYCKEHLQPHYDVAALKKHKLVEPTENLQDNICSAHDEVMKMFCRTDQQCICYLCSVDGHKGHDTVTAAAERTEKQRELEAFREKILQRIDTKEKNVARLQHEVKNVLSSANAAVVYSDQGLKELISLIEKRINYMKKQIRSQQEVEEHRVKELQDKLQQEITGLKRTQSELDSLSHTEDHLQFLHKFTSISKVSETSESSYTCGTPPTFQDMVTSALSELRNKLQEPCLLKPPTVSHNQKVNNPKRDNGAAGAQVNAPSQQNTSVDRPALTRTIIKQTSTSNPQPSQPADVFSPRHNDGSNFQTLGQLQRFSRKLTFDPNTLNYNLELSAGNTVVKRLSQSKNYSPHPLRFTYFSHVVSKEKLTGRCFWQVVGKFDEGFAVAVCEKSAVKNLYEFGHCDKSWSLECYKDKYVFWHNIRGNEFPYEPSHCDFTEIRIGVLLDHREGTLSFYRIFQEDSIYLIHKVRTVFREPLLAGVNLEDINSTATLL